MGKKPNPRKIPRTQADVDKAQRLGQAQGLNLAMTIFFIAALDKGIMERENVPKLWEAVLYASDSIKRGYINVYEQQRILEEEYGVTFSKLEY